MKENTGDFTFYIFMRAKETVDGNRGVGDEGKKIQRGLSPGKREKRGKERRHGRGGRKGKGDNVEGKDAERRKK